MNDSSINAIVNNSCDKFNENTEEFYIPLRKRLFQREVNSSTSIENLKSWEVMALFVRAYNRGYKPPIIKI